MPRGSASDLVMPRSVKARYPDHGAWPAEMRADLAAAFLDFETSGELFKAILRGEAPRPTSSRQRGGRREPTWALDALRAHVANRHDIANDGSPHRENIVSLL